MIGVGEAVGGVGIDHQRDVAAPLAHGGDRVDVPAWLDLDLDAAVARGAFDGHALDQLARANPGSRSRRRIQSRFARAAEDFHQRSAALAGVEVPGGHLDGGFGHVVAADDAERVEDLARVVELTGEHQRRDELADDVPRRLVGFGAVVRVASATHSPSPTPRRRRPSPAGTIDRHASEAGLEEPDERQGEQPQFDAFDPHRTMLSQSAESFGYTVAEP